MITNFEDITYEMTTAETQVAEYLAKEMNKKHRGQINSITSVKILKLLSRKRKSWGMSDARLRKIINYIRHKGLCTCLVATSKGYYVSRRRMEVESYLLSLDDRIREISGTKNALTKQYIKSFKN